MKETQSCAERRITTLFFGLFRLPGHGGFKSKSRANQRKKPALTVSIHQNGYSAGTKGAQVFYYKNSEESHVFAAMLQETVKEVMDDGNHRVEKGNDSYYMLKKLRGFLRLSNAVFCPTRRKRFY